MATVTLVSVEEYLELPPREDGLVDELIEGEILLSPNAKPLHAKLVRRLSRLLEPVETSGYELATDFGCILGGYSLPGPDLAAIRSERWKAVEDEDYLRGSPELVVGVFSAANRKGLMVKKPHSTCSTGHKRFGSCISKSEQWWCRMRTAKQRFAPVRA